MWYIIEDNITLSHPPSVKYFAFASYFKILSSMHSLRASACATSPFFPFKHCKSLFAYFFRFFPLVPQAFFQMAFPSLGTFVNITSVKPAPKAIAPVIGSRKAAPGPVANAPTDAAPATPATPCAVVDIACCATFLLVFRAAYDAIS